MTPDRWHHIQSIFHEALQRSGDQRRQYLAAACADDPALREQVEALLAADEAPAPVFDLAPEALASTLAPDAPEALPSVGPYRLLHEIGRGGMGAVYLAERADGHFSKRVALKLVKRGMDTDEVLRRFRHERQILASLEHPHIARLYDGGVAGDGRPFLAMEYVDGQPIVDYCDARRLSVDERLCLFATVCEAVQYAHQNLIVHRDLKPSNILVTEAGRVKLLDFGIAKLLDPDASSTSVPLTRTGVRILTPEYAAPEQIRGEAITTATDVYALGAVLYEVLTGRRPHATTGMSTWEKEQAILDADPERPSTAVTRTLELPRRDRTTEVVSPEAISERRATNIERLQRRLRGDLDTILLKALHKSPNRRYMSAEAFREDLQRHLAGLPVQARPDTTGYRLRKFVRRHRVGVAAGAVLIVMLAAFVAALAVQQAATARERDRAEQERDKAEEVAAVLEGLFDASDPFAPERVDTMQVRTFLQRKADAVEHQLADQPLVQAQILTVLGRVYYKMGLYDPAERVLERALQTRLAGPADALDVAETQLQLAAVYKEQTRYAAADSLIERALTTRRTVLGPSHPDVAAALNQYAVLLRDLFQYDQADSLFDEALAIYRSAYGPDHLDVLNVLNERAMLAYDRGDYEAAEQRFRALVAQHRDVLGHEHPQVAVTLSHLAEALRVQGNNRASEAPVREALAINRAVFGNVHPHVSANLNTLAAVYRRQGDYDQAERLIREALAINRQIRGDDHPQLAYSLTNLGEVLREQGKYEAAEQAHREALRLVRTTAADEGIDDVGIGIITGFVARVLLEKGDYTAAEPLFREALAMLRRLLPEGHHRTSDVAARLGVTLTGLGRYEEAEPLLLEGYTGLQAALGNDDARTAYARTNLEALYEAWGRPAKAEAIAQQR